MRYNELINESGEYLYHGTGEGAFRQIRLHGLLCRNGKVYFSDNESYSLTYAKRKGGPFGPRLLRVKKTDHFTPDTNMVAAGDYISNRDIPPSEIELKTPRGWIPIQDYYDEDINIMPIQK